MDTCGLYIGERLSTPAAEQLIFPSHLGVARPQLERNGVAGQNGLAGQVVSGLRGKPSQVCEC